MLSEFFSHFHQLLTTNPGAALLVRPRPLPSTSFLFHFSPIILPLDPTWSKLLTVSLNEPK